MVAQHHRCKGHEFEYAPGIGDGQGSLACCSPWGCRVATELIDGHVNILSGKKWIPKAVAAGFGYDSTLGQHCQTLDTKSPLSFMT